MDKTSCDLEFYVQSILTNRAVVVFCKLSSKKQLLKKLKAHKRWFSKYIWEIKYATNTELVKILNDLRKDGALFSSDPYGWGPSEVFFNLKEKGCIDGTINEISWLGDGKFRLRKR